MNLTQIVQQAEELGISLGVDGNRLLFTPKSRASAAFVDALREHKQELLSLLSQQDGPFLMSDRNPRNPRNPRESSGQDSVGTKGPDPSITSLQADDGTETPAGLSNKLLLLLDVVAKTAGNDHRLWDQLLTILKRSWHPAGWIPESPRDLLIAWVASNYRLARAQSERKKLNKPSLTRSQLTNRGARDADISFFSRLASGLKPWAADALQKDAEGSRILGSFCALKKDDQS